MAGDAPKDSISPTAKRPGTRRTQIKPTTIDLTPDMPISEEFIASLRSLNIRIGLRLDTDYGTEEDHRAFVSLRDSFKSIPTVVTKVRTIDDSAELMIQFTVRAPVSTNGALVSIASMLVRPLVERSGILSLGRGVYWKAELDDGFTMAEGEFQVEHGNDVTPQRNADSITASTPPNTTRTPRRTAKEPA